LLNGGWSGLLLLTAVTLSLIDTEVLSRFRFLRGTLWALMLPGANIMGLTSMTGFGRIDGHHGTCSWHWEMRTVNGRGLDVRLRLPQGFEELEIPVRETCKKKLSRGNCNITLAVAFDSGVASVRLNEDMFRQVGQVAEQAAKIMNAPLPGLDGLLSMRGVIEYNELEEGDDEREVRMAKMQSDFVKVIDGVSATRADEGERLSEAITALLAEIEECVNEVEQSPARTPEAIGNRLRKQLDRLLSEPSQIDEQRVFQEAAILAAKADVEEEIARLKAHVFAAKDLLKASEPVGRKFDFLTQEFNREANTICSKSNDTSITQSGLALKAAIDRMREQVQNIE